MTDSQDVRNEQESEMLKGDNVVNELYRSKWIARTLMSLYEIDKNGWTKELENQLHTLLELSRGPMRTEVILLLKFYDFFKIAKNTLMTSNEPRLTEIILNIIDSMIIFNYVYQAIAMIGHDRELITHFLSRLKTDDSLILIQLIRILNIVMDQVIEHPDRQSIWVVCLTECEFFGDSIISILMSSTYNDDLLEATWSLLVLILRAEDPLGKKTFWEKLFKVNDLIPAMLGSMTQVIMRETRKTNPFEWEFAQNWLECLNVVIVDCNHVVEFETEERCLRLMEIIYKILEPCKSCNLYPIKDNCIAMIYYVMDILKSFRLFKVNVSRINSILAIITFFLKTVSVSDSREEDLEAEILDLLYYLNKYWLYMISMFWSDKQIVEILRLCERDVREYIISAVQSHPEVTPEVLDKVKKVAIFFTLNPFVHS